MALNGEQALPRTRVMSSSSFQRMIFVPRDTASGTEISDLCSNTWACHLSHWICINIHISRFPLYLLKHPCQFCSYTLQCSMGMAVSHRTADADPDRLAPQVLLHTDVKVTEHGICTFYSFLKEASMASSPRYLRGKHRHFDLNVTQRIMHMNFHRYIPTCFLSMFRRK
jgi:hypothetical protein